MIQCPDDVRAKLPDLLFDTEKERIAVFVGHRDNGQAAITDVWPTDNEADEPDLNFRMSRNQWARLRRRAKREGVAIVGMAHTHIYPEDDVPSPGDLRWARACRRNFTAWVIYHPHTDTLIWYDADGETEREQVRQPGILRRLFSW